MRKESLNIAIACFIGGVLGVLFAVKIAEMYEFGRYLWFIGAFLGGAVAYLAYDPWAAASAMWRAWHELADVEHAKRFLRGVLAAAGIMTAVVVMISGIGFTFFGGFLWGDSVGNVWTLTMILSLVFCAFLTSIYPKRMGRFATKALGEPKAPRGEPENLQVVLWTLAAFINPVSFPLIIVTGTLVFVGCILYDVVRFLVLVLARVPKGIWLSVVFAVRFIRLVFVYIHSTARVVCFVDTALGVAVAYTLVAPTLQMMLAGGVLGLVFGVLNYELISVRLLKLVPARANAKK